MSLACHLSLLFTDLVETKNSFLVLPPPPRSQGQLISESGTMSGGGGRPSRGRMALGSAAPKGGNLDAKAVQAELKQAEQQLEEITQVCMESL